MVTTKEMYMSEDPEWDDIQAEQDEENAAWEDEEAAHDDEDAAAMHDD